MNIREKLNKVQWYVVADRGYEPLAAGGFETKLEAQMLRHSPSDCVVKIRNKNLKGYIDRHGDLRVDRMDEQTGIDSDSVPARGSAPNSDSSTE